MSASIAKRVIITKEDALRGLRWAVEQRGADFDYLAGRGTTDCLYVRIDGDGEMCPDCIVGYALSHLGVPLSVLNDFPDRIEEHIDELWQEGYELEPGAVAVLDAAQTVQDGRSDGDSTWGAALRAAESEGF